MNDPDRDDEFMALALEEAERAATHGDVPIGAVIVDDQGLVLGRGRNERELRGDPTAHAEIVALRDASSVVGHWRIEATLYVTLEPCVMCAGALVNARIQRVVFGALDPKAGAVESLYSVGDDARMNHRYPSRGGVLRAESVELLQAFFRRLRAEGQK